MSFYDIQEQEYLRLAQDVWDIAWKMGQTNEGWKLEAGSENLVNGGVHIRKFDSIGKVYRLQVRAVPFKVQGRGD